LGAIKPELRLPPSFTPVRLRERGDAFAHALAIAATDGAGTLVYVGRFDLAEFALVLEPDEPLARARLAFYAGMTALTEALVANALPETLLEIRWPDTVTVNFALVGGGRLEWPEGIAENEVPPWLVFGGMIRTNFVGVSEPGLNPSVTSLDQEGFEDIQSGEVIASFARNFMVALDGWQEKGFAAVARPYLELMPREESLSRSIAENGDLLERRGGKVERRAFLPALEAAQWYDPQTKAPRA
jgi:biotin/lipoate A/B protein ligase family protein